MADGTAGGPADGPVAEGPVADGSDGWTTPAGWGAPSGPPPSAPPVATPSYGAPTPSYGPTPPGYGTPPPGGAGAYGAWGPPRSELKPGVVPLRPLGLGEVLDGAVGVLRRYPRPALGLAAIVAVVSVLVQTLLSTTLLRPLLDLDPTAVGGASQQALEDAVGGAFAAGAVAVLLAVITGALLTGALTAVVGKAVLGQSMSFAEAWAAVRPVLLKLIALSLLTTALVGGVVGLAAVGAVALGLLGTGGVVLGVLLVLGSLLPAVYLYVRLSLAPCALALERTGIRTSLRRSSVLVRGDWWRVFGILLLVLVISSFVALTLQVPFELLGAGSVGSLFDPTRDVLGARTLILSGIGGVVSATLVSPFSAGAQALLYVDRRMRAEGLDVALAAAATARS